MPRDATAPIYFDDLRGIHRAIRWLRARSRREDRVVFQEQQGVRASAGHYLLVEIELKLPRDPIVHGLVPQIHRMDDQW